MPDITFLWRDLELGEEVKSGDRCMSDGRTWWEMGEEHLTYTNVVGECSYPIQRKINQINLTFKHKTDPQTFKSLLALAGRYEARCPKTKKPFHGLKVELIGQDN